MGDKMKRIRSILHNFKALAIVFEKSFKILLLTPEIISIFIIGIFLNSLISYVIYEIWLLPLFPLYSTTTHFWQIDPVVPHYGDFLKLVSQHKIPLSLFILETLRSSLFFFINTTVAVILGKVLKNKLEKKQLNIVKESFLSKELIGRLFFWTSLYQILFLTLTPILEYIFSSLGIHNNLYYSLSLMTCSILVFYINPIFAIESKPVLSALEEVLYFIKKTRVINIVWVIGGALWLTYLGDPRTNITPSNITILSGIMLFAKSVISPIAAVLWYYSIKKPT